MTNQRFNIQLEVVTPISVGTGNQNDWVKGTDFVQFKNKVYVLDLRKIMACGLDIDKINMCFINQDEEGICQLLENHIGEVAKYVFHLPTKTDNPIKTFLRTQIFDRPLIPGSSIKGAIRSALFNFLRENERKNEEIFGQMKTGDDFMRFLKIGDVEMKSTILANTKIFNLFVDKYEEWAGGWKHGLNTTSDKFNATGFNTLYECVPPGEKGMGTVVIASADFQQLLTKIGYETPHVEKKQSLMNEGIRGFFRVINNVTKNYLKKERDFFMHYETERTDEIVECINNLISLIPNDNTYCLLKMSAGVGFHSITGDWQYSNYINTGSIRGKLKYKSRKITEYEGKLMLMGFVKLCIVPEDKATKEMAALIKEHQGIMEDIRVAPLKRYEMHRRIEQEKIERIEQEKKYQQIQKEYKDLISQAKQLYIDNNNHEAKEKVQKAKNLWPDGPDHQKLLDDISKSILIEQNQLREEEEKRKHLSQQLSVVLKGKTSIGNIIGHLTKWLQIDGNSFGDEETTALADALRSLPNKERNKLKSSQKRFASIIGEEYAIKVFENLK